MTDREKAPPSRLLLAACVAALQVVSLPALFLGLVGILMGEWSAGWVLPAIIVSQGVAAFLGASLGGFTVGRSTIALAAMGGVLLFLSVCAALALLTQSRDLRPLEIPWVHPLPSLAGLLALTAIAVQLSVGVARRAPG